MKVFRANIIDTPTKDAFRMLERGYLVVDDEGLVVGTFAHLPSQYISLPLSDYGDKLLIPSFVDLHVHAPQYRNLGLAMDMELLPWLNMYTFPEETKFRDPEYAGYIYRRFVHELWMQGTMHSAVFATIHPEATKLLADIFLQSGLGAFIGLVGMNRNCPDTLSNTTDEVVRDTLSLHHYLQQVDPSGRVRAIVTPRFVPSCTEDMLQALGDLAQSYHLPVQSHLSENKSEIAWVRELEPDSRSYGDAYNRYGLFGQTPTLMAHCCYTEGHELELVKKNGVVVVHCPASNTNIASGIAPVRTFLDHHIPVALGSDISGGHNLSMLRTIHYAIQASKHIYTQTGHRTSFLSLSEAFYLATKAGGQFFGHVGSFEQGMQFDALLIDDSYLNYNHYTLLQRMERYIYLGDDRDIRIRFYRGKEVPEPCYD